MSFPSPNQQRQKQRQSTKGIISVRADALHCCTNNVQYQKKINSFYIKKHKQQIYNYQIPYTKMSNLR